MLRDVSRPTPNLLGLQFMSAVNEEVERVDVGEDIQASQHLNVYQRGSPRTLLEHEGIQGAGPKIGGSRHEGFILLGIC